MNQGYTIDSFLKIFQFLTMKVKFSAISGRDTCLSGITYTQITDELHID